MQKPNSFFCRSTILMGLVALFFVNDGNAQDSMQMQVVYHWTDTTMTQEIFYDSRFNEIWGMAVNGREYAAMGSTEGLHIFDITDPATASEILFLSGGNNPGPQFVIHRDFKTYQHYLYEVSDEDRIGLRVYDMQYLPDSMPLVYDSDTLLQKSHNIFIDEAKGRLYACNVNLVGGGFYPMSVYSLADPVNPQFEFSLFGIGHAHDVYVRNDTAYVNAGGDGLWVVDYSTATPQIINTLISYPEQGYNHSGWLSEDGNTYVFADETHGTRLKIMDVSDVNNWQIVSYIGSGVHPLSIPHNQMLKGNLLFSSYYYDGVQVFDISDPTTPQRIAWYDTYQPAHVMSYHGNWGVYCLLPSGRILASDMQSGLFVLEMDSSVLVGVENPMPSGFEAAHLWPNPTATSIHLKLNMAAASTLRIDLYTADGRWVKALMENTILGQGEQLFQFDLGNDLPSGHYFIKGYDPKVGSFVKAVVKQ